MVYLNFDGFQSCGVGGGDHKETIVVRCHISVVFTVYMYTGV